MKAKELSVLLSLTVSAGEEEIISLASDELDGLIRSALNKRDAAFFGELVKAFRLERKFHHSKYEAERVPITKAYRKLRQAGADSKIRPTWRAVIECAQKEFGLPKLHERTLQRIRSEMRLSRLPNPPRGKAKKG
jgi:hypothetical protein